MIKYTHRLILCVALLCILCPQFARTQEEVLNAGKIWKNLTQAEISLMWDFLDKTVPEHGLYMNFEDRRLVQEAIRAANPALYRDRVVAPFVRSVRQFYGGYLTPTEVASDIRFVKKSLTEDKIRMALADSNGSLETFVSFYQPKIVDYRVHVQMLERLRDLEKLNRWGSLGLTKSLRLGVNDTAVIRVKNRLLMLGYKINVLDNNYDEETANAIADVQIQMKVQNPDRVISKGGATQRYLELPLRQRIAQVQADLEKIRWLPQDPKDRYVFVNLAFSYFMLIDRSQPNPVVFNFKTINGREARKTPSMVDRIYDVVLNPFWTVPKTILLEDKIPLIRQMNRNQIREYFQKYNYVIFSEDMRKKYDPTTLNWNRMNEGNINFHMRQRPNYFSALGVVRFPMTNKEFIYLHDTGERELFQQNQRLLSSGCIRLEQPLDFAEYLLMGTEWTRSAIENFVSREGEVKDEETWIRLQNSIPVYTLPVTSHMASDGVMRFSDDVYGHNQQIFQYTNGL